MPLNLEEEQAEKLKRMAAWQVRSTAIQTRKERSLKVESVVAAPSCGITKDLMT